jgi:lipopolysaccharide export system protein LptA
VRALAALVLTAALCGAAAGAELYAKKMEIVREPEGELTVFRDSVVITDGDTRIDARLARLNDRAGRATISDAVRIESPDAKVWADSALYYLDERRAELFGAVRVRRESLDITAPWLEYQTREQKVNADRGLTLTDQGRDFRLSGERGTYDMATDVGVVDVAPVLTWQRGADSARVTGRRMVWEQESSRAVVQGDVKMTSGESELRCDTALYYSGPDSGVAWGSPNVRDRQSEASGDTMTFHVRDGSLERVNIRGNATGEYRTDGGERVVVTGAGIGLALAGGEIDRVEVSQMTSGQLIRQGGEKKPEAPATDKSPAEAGGPDEK